MLSEIGSLTSFLVGSSGHSSIDEVLVPETLILLDKISKFVNEMIAVVSSGIFWIGIMTGAIILIGVWMVYIQRRFSTSQISLSLPFGLGNVVYETTDKDRVLAWKMFVQLKTRKAALPFDESNDLVANVYDSLHGLFSITRELLSEACPRNGDRQRTISDYVLRVVNDGIRPHLTQWHPVFRSWWENAIDRPENRDRRPQELQRDFPEYDDLLADLKQMNTELARYADELLAIVVAAPDRAKRSTKPLQIKPEQPAEASVGACGPVVVIQDKKD